MTPQIPDPVGLVGLGSMGAGMARNLLRRGHGLRVYARRPEVLQPLVKDGAQAAPSPAALARECRIVILSLPDGTAVEDVLFGAGGLAEELRPGSVVVDTSTIAIGEAQELGVRLARQGVQLLDAPVSGGQAGATSGTLGCMIGGPAEAVESVRGVLGAFCKTIIHAGALGAGQTIKACNQAATAGALLGVAEAIVLARAQGVDPHLMRDVLLGGAARSFPLEKHGPRIIDGSFTPGFRAALMRKDLRLALDAAHTAGAALPSTALAEQLLDAMCSEGRGDWDWCAVALQVQKLSGQPIAQSMERDAVSAA